MTTKEFQARRRMVRLRRSAKELEKDTAGLERV